MSYDRDSGEESRDDPIAPFSTCEREVCVASGGAITDLCRTAAASIGSLRVVERVVQPDSCAVRLDN